MVYVYFKTEKYDPNNPWSDSDSEASSSFSESESSESDSSVESEQFDLENAEEGLADLNHNQNGKPL